MARDSCTEDEAVAAAEALRAALRTALGAHDEDSACPYPSTQATLDVLAYAVPMCLRVRYGVFSAHCKIHLLQRHLVRIVGQWISDRVGGKRLRLRLPDISRRSIVSLNTSEKNLYIRHRLSGSV
jgi:hypothetical protein